MKNLIQKISRIFAILILIPIISISFVGCDKNNDPSNPPSNPPTEQTQEVDDNPNSPIKSGIYYFEKDLSLDNIFYLNEAEVISFFKTRDLNGVKLAALNLGFIDFAQSLTISNNLDKCIEFNKNNEVITYTIKNNLYTSIDSFKYSYTEATATFKTSSVLAPTIAFEENTNDVYLLYKFSYVDENEQTVITPLYVKAKLIYTCSSFEAMTNAEKSTTFTYKDGSAQIINSSSNTDLETIYTKLASKFNLENTENIIESINELVSGCKVAINNEFTLAVCYQNLEDSIKFTFSTISEQAFVVNGVQFKIINIPFTPSLTQISAIMMIDETSFLQLNFEVK